MILAKARLKLTLWYTVIMMVITILFSVIIYGIQMEEVLRSVQSTRVIISQDFGMLPRPERVIFIDTAALQTARENIIRKLVVANLGILLITAGAANFLSDRTLQPIEQSINNQKHFISDASHEMRTPLTAMRTTLEVSLRNKLITGDAREALEDSLNEVTRLHRLADSLLNLSLLEGEQTQSFTNTSLRTLLEDTLHTVKPHAEKKSITIHLPEQDATLQVNPTQMIEVFTILLDNAVKYSPHESEVWVSWIKQHNHIVVSFVDHGIGIDKQDIKHIFDRFYRSDRARTSAGGGYGLGLAIAKRIVEIHHGTIQVTSTVGSGSTFVVTLPMQ